MNTMPRHRTLATAILFALLATVVAMPVSARQNNDAQNKHQQDKAKHVTKAKDDKKSGEPAVHRPAVQPRVVQHPRNSQPLPPRQMHPTPTRDARASQNRQRQAQERQDRQKQSSQQRNVQRNAQVRNARLQATEQRREREAARQRNAARQTNAAANARRDARKHDGQALRNQRVEQQREAARERAAARQATERRSKDGHSNNRHPDNRPDNRGPSSHDRRISHVEQQGRVKRERARAADYRRYAQSRHVREQQRARQLQQQKRMSQYRYQQAYYQRLRAQQSRLTSLRYNYSSNPYFYSPAAYRYSYGGNNYTTNQYGADLLRQAVNYGYREGLRSGEADRRDGWRSDYRDNYAYRDASYGYDNYYVDRDEYNYYFRQGFQRGYNDGFQRRSQYGSYNQHDNDYGNASILQTVLSVILNLQPMNNY